MHDDTFAFWRRVRCIDFPKRFQGNDVDPDLKRTLAAESEGILAWCIRQAVQYLALPGNLPVPEGVAIKTDEYQSETDPLAEFFAEKCEEGEHLVETFNDLHNAYCDWADARHLNQREQVSSTAFSKRLATTFSKKRAAGGGPIRYHGIGLRRPKPRSLVEP